MPEHDVILSPRAERFLKAVSPMERDRLRERLRRLGEVPVPSDAKFVGRHAGDRVFRYRIGPYRALYKLKDHNVLIVEIGRRDHIYD